MTNRLIDRNAFQLATAIGQRQVSSREVVQAFIERIEAVDGRLNAVVWRRFDASLAEADQADSTLPQVDPRTRPLHGVPITIKEMFDVAETPTTAGLTGRSDHRAAFDAVAVSRLRAAGAIVLGKTNVPQFGIYAESDNPLYGRTSNPWSLERSPGGSSGGEAAIVAARGSPWGLGSDGGGSIRQPCHCCGLFGLKPTGGRLSMLGHWLSANWPVSWAQPGPIARTVSDLELAYNVLRGRPDLPVTDSLADSFGDESNSGSRLKIGYATQIGDMTACPAARRAVRVAVQRLVDRGHEVIEFDMPNAAIAWRIYMQMFYAEGLTDLRRQLRGSRRDHRVSRLLLFAKIPRLLRQPLALLAGLKGDYSSARMLRWVRRPVLSAKHYCRLQLEQEAYRLLFRAAMARQGVDVLLAPVYPVPALLHDQFNGSAGLLYPALVNLLAMPAGAVPVTCVRAGEESDRPRDADAANTAFGFAERGSAGLPVAVQAIAPWWRERDVLTVMRHLERSLRDSDDFPPAREVPLDGSSA